MPFTRKAELFTRVAHLGRRLVDLHLLKSPELDSPIARLQPTGANKVEKPRYSDNERRVYINETQHFEGVEPEVWAYQIGGYQVMDKWLKDRKGKCLDLEHIRHYCRMASALKETMATQKKIDAAYNDIEQGILLDRITV